MRLNDNSKMMMVIRLCVVGNWHSYILQYIQCTVVHRCVKVCVFHPVCFYMRNIVGSTAGMGCPKERGGDFQRKSPSLILPLKRRLRKIIARYSISRKYGKRAHEALLLISTANESVIKIPHNIKYISPNSHDRKTTVINPVMPSGDEKNIYTMYMYVLVIHCALDHT